MSEFNHQIVAIGGGGFSAEPPTFALDRYILRQSHQENPAVCFIPTASGDSPNYIARFYESYRSLPCRPTHLTLFKRTPDLRALLLAQDVIYIGGGNTKSMLAVWQEWELPHILKEAWHHGVVLAGISAGAICWFDSGVTDSWADRLHPLPCMGFLSGACCPHYDGEPERRPALHRFVTEGTLPTTLALDDGVGAHFVGTDLLRLISDRPGAAAYWVRNISGTAIEDVLLPVQLSSG